jgi:DNA-binding LacI/PurR family transcriptional regulator
MTRGPGSPPAVPAPARSTLTGIAAEAGVSVSTVSKVLNGRTDVAPGTRERIGRLLRRHGYELDSRLGFGIVDLLIGIGDCPPPTRHEPWAEELIQGAVEAAAQDQHVVVVTTVGSPSEFNRWLELAAARGTVGALSILHLPHGEELKRLAAAEIPVVVIDPVEEPGAGIRSVGTTNWHGGLSATRHLIELGHRRIAAICGPEGLWSSRARLDGYRAAMQEAGLTVDKALIRRGQFSVDTGREQSMHLLGLADPPTAIVAGSDSQAFGVLQALSQLRLRAPDDVSVVGFDDVPVAAWATPPLTTIRQPLAAMAATAFRMLRASGAENQTQHVELATTLIVRQSTAPPPPRPT